MFSKNCITTILERIFVRPAIAHWGFILYLLFIQMINYVVEEVEFLDFIPYYAAYLIEIAVFCIFLSLLPKKVEKCVKWVLIVLATFVTIVDSYCYMRIGAAFGPEMVMLMDETNKEETWEFINSYILSTDTLKIIGIYGGFILCCLIVFFARKKIGFTLRRKRRVVVKSLCVVLFYSLIVGAYYTNKIEHVLFFRTYIYKWNTTALLEKKATGKFYHQRCTPGFRFYASFYAQGIAAKDIDIIAEHVEKTVVDTCSFTSPNIVFIIGEAYNKHHASLYGYDKPTTPCLDQLYKERKLFRFNDVISCWNMTSAVFKNFMSTHSIDEPGSWSSETLFPALFKKAGYHVDFITNEFAHQGNIDMHDFAGGFFLNGEKISSKLFDHRNPEKFFLDESLLTFYDDKLKCKDDSTLNRLVMFHLIGQHVNYKLRCPIKKLKFKRADYDHRTDLKDKEKDILAAYDNSIRYNDSIVNQIIKRFEDKDAIVIYMPDHGEEVYDETHMFGRDLSLKITPAIARHEFGIPFLVWCSSLYRKNHPAMVKQIRRAVNKPFMTDDISHVLLYLAGIKCKEYDDERNLFSPHFNASRKRLLKGSVDYDKLVNGK